MADKLSEDLRPASFRGVPFHVRSTDIGAGRRTQVHDYPQRDKPYVEDLGRATRELQFTGFLVGVDYVEQANTLLGALETAGPAELVHPWFGTMTVSLKELGKVSFDGGLGEAAISMSFVESGDLEFPAATDSTEAQTCLAAEALEEDALADFTENFSIDGFPDFVSDLASLDISSVFEFIGGGSIPGLDVLGFVDRLPGALQDAIDFISDPSALGETLLGYVGLAGFAGSALRWASLVRSLVRLVDSDKLANPVASVVYTPSRQQAYQNTLAIKSFARQALLAQAVGASSLMPATVHEETIAVRNELTAALDAESLTASDAVYGALIAARAAVWKDLTTRARDSARLTTLTPKETLPALVVAYDYYEDAGRDSEIVTRNGIRHPGFVPADPLKVLTR
ncbi:MAG: hypothetical protein H6R18_1948 [Proteobacteria bacterium]|nr:hypothetical protein [Pseudomonadota bacterium]